MRQTLCPCGSDLDSDECCQPIIEGKKTATTPEQLMRSRYTAFCLSHADYLCKTLHVSKHKQKDWETLEKKMGDTKWLGLKVLQAGIDPNNQSKGYVEFIAYWIPSKDNSPNMQTSNVQQLHEHSAFLKENNQWYYLEGDMLPPVKLQRNELCWCGSGKKLKKCHG